MIIDKVKPFWTPEYKMKLDTIGIDLELDPEEEIGGENWEPDKSPNIEKLEALLDERRKVIDEVRQQYINSFADDPTGLYRDAQEIVDSLEKEEFISHINEMAESINSFYGKYSDLSEVTSSYFEETLKENWDNARAFIRGLLRDQLHGILFYNLDTNKLNEIAEKKASLWYPQKPAFLPLAHGKVTDAFAYMNSKSADIDQITNTAIIERDSVKLTISNFIDKSTSLGINTDKLLSTTIALFTQHNDLKELAKREEKEPKRYVSFSLKDYAEAIGYDLTEHRKPTEEEQIKEKKRVKKQIDNARQKIKKDLDLLQASTLEWREHIKGTGDYFKVSLVTSTGIRNGTINIALSPEFAGYLSQRQLITQYPQKLLLVDARDPNTYYIGRKIAEHYNIDNNQKKGTHTKLSVISLLAVTSLPTYEEVQAKDRGHWERKIKEPLENSLEKLVSLGVIGYWKYTHAKGVDLTDEEAYNITSYYDFSNLYVEFSLSDPVDHTERIARKDADRKTAYKRAKKKRG